MYRVVVVDDHEMILESIVRLLAADPRINIVGTALTGIEGIESVRDQSPDVLVIDYHLPDMDAPEAIAAIRNFDRDVKIVTLSGSERPGAQLSSMKAGSATWVRKTRAIHELIDAILLVAVGEPRPTDERDRLPTMDELVVRYQPVVKLYDERIVGFEALVYWQHPEKGLLPPDSFLPVAIETGFIEDVERWVREQAFGQLVQWQQRCPTVPRLWMSVNLSSGSVADPRFMGSLARAITDSGVHARDVIVEINELILLDDPESAVEFLSQLSDLGVRLALEKFGSSFSPISYMHRISFDCLKIDRSFTAKLLEPSGTMSLVESISKFAGSMGMMCVVEGVEHFDQVIALRSVGLDIGQGPKFSPPISAQNCEVLLARSFPHSVRSPQPSSSNVSTSTR